MAINYKGVLKLSKRKSLVGNIYERLKVINMLYQYKNNRTYCECVCECGNNLIVQASSLNSGNTKSCGCINRENLELMNLRKRQNTYKYLNKKNDIKKSNVKIGSPKCDYTNMKFGYLLVSEMLYHYKDGKTYCKCLCDCGKETIRSINKLKHSKSCGCSRNSEKNNLNKTRDLIGFRIGKITVTKKTELRSKSGNVIWVYQCDCGKTGTAPGTDITKGSIRSCGCNYMSQYESYMINYLNSKNIEYIAQKTFEDCKNIRLLPFDFFLPQYNICIECQGQQHYYPVDFFGGNEKFLKTCKNDKIKKEFCSSNNIELICLPYTLSATEIDKIMINKIKSRNDYSDMSNHTHMPLAN